MALNNGTKANGPTAEPQMQRRSLRISHSVLLISRVSVPPSRQNVAHLLHSTSTLCCLSVADPSALVFHWCSEPQFGPPRTSSDAALLFAPANLMCPSWRFSLAGPGRKCFCLPDPHGASPKCTNSLLWWPRWPPCVYACICLHLLVFCV
eukprot:EG_transcript_18787